MLRTSFKYALPNGQTIWIDYRAEDVSSMFLVNPSFAAYDLQGNPLEIVYVQEIFDDIEDMAHTLIYEGEMDEQENPTSQIDSNS